MTRVIALAVGAELVLALGVVPAKAADFDGDGGDDLVIGSPGNSDWRGSVALLNSDVGGLGAGTNDFFTQGVGGLPGDQVVDDGFGESVAAGDFNGDGLADLVGSAAEDEIAGHEGAGSIMVIPGSPSGPDRAQGRLITQDSVGVAGAVADDQNFGWATVAGSFGGGPQDDLAVSVTNADVRGVPHAGGVIIFYGSPTGLRTKNSQYLTLATRRVKGRPQDFSYWGSALAAGDVAGNGRDDLVVGYRAADAGAVLNAGAVSVLRGARSGIIARGGQHWTQDKAGFTSDVADGFGASLAVGEFGGGAKGDLAVGAPGDAASGVTGGSVFVLFSSGKAGLSALDALVLTQDSPSVSGVAENTDQFGASLAAGDLMGDARDDLVIGAPSEDFAAIGDGYVHVLPGTVSGPTGAGSQAWGQNTGAVEGVAEDSDGFGEALAIADFDNSGRDDLAIGVPGETVGASTSAGAVNVLFNNGVALSDAGDQYWQQDSLGIGAFPGSNEFFGSSLV